MNNRTEKLTALLRLSHELGNPKHPILIFDEWN
jgi:hypothetical protein